MKPFVSILIPCYNAERWIIQAIESALNQTWAEKEVIVMDDGSTDRSLELIKTFGTSIRWETGPNRGGNAARNRLLHLARGDCLQYLDADDYLLKEKVKEQVEFLMDNPETDIIFSPLTLEHSFSGKSELSYAAVPEPRDPWILLARWFLPGTGSGIWKKQAIIDVGSWDEEQLCCQEHELYLRLLMAGKVFKYHPGGGYIYRQWSEHTVSKRNRSEVHRRRLEIELRAEDFLRRRNELTLERLQAINQARFEVARMAWLYDRKFAGEVIQTIRHSQSGFVPGGQAAPSNYRALYRMMGFQATERLAAWKRKLRGAAT